jgi:hypothetical protein
MIIVLKKMIKETAVFFLLLIVIAAGFIQSFFAYPLSPLLEFFVNLCSLGASEGGSGVTKKVLHSMTQAFLDAPDFEFYKELTPPFGLYLFYFYNFIVSICTSPFLSFLFPLVSRWCWG